ncbi:citrate transporter [Jannaschia pagri]|uniref:Citrate transporter n=1 Tax=Jannaschia pagri TaxID=2829797 RepID=A0ABQ4NRI4_9RHOB|nr:MULTISPECIES: GntP family permease [unclassified Jannaschia]GIT92852.1 citrate transporter [Jannaschia sp. AI_61]GIT96687.1 citrate transporter [Jannaschia sp. AI_62]
MAIVGTLLLPLGMMIWAVYRGWPILLVAPIMALAAAGLAGDPVLATLTERFMPATGRFVVAFLPLFLLGAVFGKLMEASGAAMAIARAIVDRLGAEKALVAVVLSCAVLTYGGVSLFVVAFAVYPLAVALFRQADLPHRLIPAAIALGAFTFTMSALPGSPAIQNAIPMPYFGTTLFAAPGIGMLAGGLMAVGGVTYLARAARSGAAPVAPRLTRQVEQADLPSLWLSLTPIVAVFVANLVLAQGVLPRLDLSYLADPAWGNVTPTEVIGLWALICALGLATLIALALSWSRLAAPKETLGAGAQAALLPLFNTAVLVGFGAVVAGLPAFQSVSALTAQIPGGVLTSLAASASLLAGLTGSASGGMSIALDTLGPRTLELAQQQAVDPAALHRIVALATGGLDALPHNGAVVTLLGIAGLTHREAYGPVFVVAVVIPTIALLLALATAVWVGVF